MFVLTTAEHNEEFSSLNECMVVARSYIKSGYIVKIFEVNHFNKV